MRPIELTADQPSFRTIRFEPAGISLIVGGRSRKDETGSDKTYNGVGKSLVIALIHFCLRIYRYLDRGIAMAFQAFVRLPACQVGFVVCCLLVAPMVQASPWARVATTAAGPAAVIGGPANGCVAGAQALPATGTGFVSIRRHRNRYYGHPDTIRLVWDLGKALSRHTGGLMMVGDLSQPRGGPMSSMHRSHQNGMDVDIWFRLATSARSANDQHPEHRDPASMVAPGGHTLNQDWGEPQRLLLKTSAEHPRVDRVIVNPVIKRALCRTEQGDRGWLRKLRPWWGHDAHVHIRLKCPRTSPYCRQQPPPPAGDGCDQSLAWWFSEEAKRPAKKSKKKKAKPPLPAACTALLSGS
ncbi:MAG: penicillin-insensitive murein endopeptidase [Candidatus Thiosymbion ectosymbiont of Robbea hypermnestra]|nr:penicillin-insensitive murein endopeptidase [Candidatus Thiosymbion ectosymbiont of Robbea hypermnestra]